MAGEIKNTIDKVTDTIGGTAGKMGAAMTVSADGFVESAAIGDRYEIEAARLALRLSNREEVQAIAHKMIDDHTTSTHHLMAALEMNETSGVAAPPRELDARRRTMVEHLAEAPADAFDTTYLDQQVLAHEETSTLMRSYSEGGDNPQLRSFAAGTLPVVNRHLKKMKQIRSRL